MSKAKRKRIGILLIVLGVLCLITFLVMRHEEKKEEIENSGETVMTLDPDTATALDWSYEDTSLAFHKDGDSWLYDEDEAFPVNREKITELLQTFEELQAAFTIENPDDLGQYGLDDPTCTIHITTEDGEKEILLGDYSQMDEERYVSIGDGNVYLLTEDPYTEYEVTLENMIRNDDTPVVSTADSITFSDGADYEIVYDSSDGKSVCPDDVYYMDDKPLDTDRVKDYLQTFSYMDLSEYVTYNATEEELEEYGLADPEQSVTVAYSYEDENGEDQSDTCTIHVGRNADEVAAWEAEHPDGEAEEETDDSTVDSSSDDTGAEESAYTTEDDETEDEGIPGYVRVGDSKIIYKVNSETCEELLAASYDDLRHQQIVTAPSDKITQIDVTLDGEDYTLTSEDAKSDDEERSWKYGDNDIDLTDLENALTGITADSFTDEDPAEDAKEEISLTLTLEDENFPKISLQFYRVDGENCLALVNGESMALVPRTNVVDLIEAVNAIIL